MKKALPIIILALVALAGMAQQKPKQHIFYDTVKTVNQRIDYSPDTIPVYFKEFVLFNVGTLKRPNRPDSVLSTGDPNEIWREGFVIWQTFRKSESRITFSSNNGLWNGTIPDYYTREYEDNSISGKFLYIDKTPVTNKIIYTIKR